MYRITGADGKEYGPVSADQVRQWVAEGRANAQTLVQAEGRTEWKPLAVYPELTMPSAGPTPPPVPTATTGRIPNYLVQSILVTVCCCLPLGIPAIIFAAQVNSKLAAGDVTGALESSRKAKLWCWLAFGLGLAAQLVYGVFYLALLQRGAVHRGMMLP